ncbi:MAG TPA: hypothetical protein ENK18_23160 [Deltaproteobacteria bacterium]|nr:hypothetical protein [Deltaproteobacteria bacterium]
MSTPTRRHLLKLGLFGAGLLAVGGVGLGLRPGSRAPVPRTLAALEPDAFRVLAAVADRICPATGLLPPAAELRLAERVDAHLATLHPDDVAELSRALLLLENALAGLLIGGSTVPFTLRPPEAQDRTLARWRGSRFVVLRSAFKALRTLCVTAYYADPRVGRAIGYPGPPDYGQRSAPALQVPQRIR